MKLFDSLRFRIATLFQRSQMNAEMEEEPRSHTQHPADDLERFGLRFVASPRHADVLMVTGPVTKNMREALARTYHATPNPKWVIAVGDCARDGGCFAGSYAVVGGVSEVIPVDLHISGCPPPPTAMLEGLLALLERVDAAATP